MNDSNVDYPGSAGQDLAWEDMFNFDKSLIGTGIVDGNAWEVSTSGRVDNGEIRPNSQAPPPWSVPIATEMSFPPTSFAAGNGTSGALRPDQAAISSALMDFIAEMSRNSS